MIAYLTLAIAVCTIVLVLFMSFDVLRNRSVVDKTREDIESGNTGKGNPVLR